MLLFCKSTKNSANNLSALCWLVLLKLKGIVHPKNKNSLIIFTLVLFQTCTSLFLLLNGKEDILKNVVTRQWFSPLLWKSMATINCLSGYKTFSKISSFVFNRNSYRVGLGTTWGRV